MLNSIDSIYSLFKKEHKSPKNKRMNKQRYEMINNHFNKNHFLTNNCGNNNHKSNTLNC